MNTNGKENQKGRGFFLALFVVLGVLVFFLLKPYWGVLALALVVVVMLKPLYNFFMDRTWSRGRPRVATTFTLLTSLLLIFIPLLLIGILFFSQVGELLNDLSSIEVEASLTDIVAEIENLLAEIPTLSEIEINQDQVSSTLLDLATAVLSSLANLAVRLGTSLPNLFISGLIFVIVVATALPMWDELGARVQELSPLDVDITQIYFLKGREMIASVIKGVFLLAIIQGLIMGVFYWLAGVPFNVFWTLLSMAFAILPVVGISFIVLPMVIIFLLQGNVTSAILLLIGFYVFVNPLDLLLRPRLVSKEAYLNFTLMLLALFAGLAVGGLLGMIYGPVIMILFITTLDIYAGYFSEPKEEPAVVRGNSNDLEPLTDTTE